MENNNDDNGNFYQLIDYIHNQSIGKKYLIDQINTTVLKMIIEYAFKNAKQLNDYDFLGLFAENDTAIQIYMKTRNEDLLDFIIKNLSKFDKKQFTKQFMDIVVKNIDRDSYLDIMASPITPNLSLGEKGWRIQHNALVTKKYDDAVKRRVADVSAGLGYQGMPNLVLDAIIGETVDTSGMTAYKVDKIIGKFNLWKTDTTMRIGENEDAYQSQFKDAYIQDDDDAPDDEIIEI
jgi:hypothetical protein